MKIVRRLSQLTPEARLQIGRATQLLEHDHNRFLSAHFHFPTCLYSPTARLQVMSVFTVDGSDGVGRVFSVVRLAARCRFRWVYGSGDAVKCVVVKKWQVGDSNLSMLWHIVADRPRLPFHKRIASLFGVVDKRRVESVVMSGYSHFSFSQRTGLVKEHRVDQVVPPPNMRLLSLLANIFMRRPPQLAIFDKAKD